MTPTDRSRSAESAARTALPEGWWLATTWGGDRVHFMNPYMPGKQAICGQRMDGRVDEHNGYDDVRECRRCLSQFDGYPATEAPS